MRKGKSKNRKTMYQKRSTYANQQPKPITWLVGGILIGLVIPAILYFKPHANTEQSFPPKVEREVRLNQSKAYHAPRKKEPPTQNAQYEFYNLLSSQEENPASFKEGDNQLTQPDKFLLEIADFDNYLQADRLKAELLLLGIDNITIAKNTRGKHPGFRVVAGPYTSRLEANKTQKQLKENAIHSILIISNSP